MSKRSFYVRESELDDFQRQVLNKKVDKSFIVKGCAGSGKSILALWKAHDIVSNNRGSLQIIVFNKALKSYMEEALRAIGINPSLVDYWHHWKRDPERSDYLIVDEIQDFGQEAIDAFLSSARIVIFYGDSAQQLYGWRREDTPLSVEKIAAMTGLSTENLVFNHRLPKTIARFAQYICPEGDDLENRCRNEGSEKPYVLEFDSYEEEMKGIASIINNREFDDIGILFPKNEDVDNAARFFSANGLKVEKKTSSDMDLNWSTTNPKLMTYHSAKGAQFEAVFIPECTAGDSFRNALYVAATRAYQSLYITYTDYLSPLLCEIPSELFNESLSSSTNGWFSSRSQSPANSASSSVYDEDIPF